jgi:hypothetical protein
MDSQWNVSMVSMVYEMDDGALVLVYYNYRHYNPDDIKRLRTQK